MEAWAQCRVHTARMTLPFPQSSLPRRMWEKPWAPSSSWSPQPGKAQTLGSFGEESLCRRLTKPCWLLPGPFLLLSSVSCALSLALSVSLLVCVWPCLHPVSLCLVLVDLSFSVSLPSTVFSVKLLCMCDSLFFLVFSLVSLSHYVTLSLLVFVSLPVFSSLFLHLSLSLCPSVYHPLFSFSLPSSFSPSLLRFSCPSTTDFHDLSFTDCPSTPALRGWLSGSIPLFPEQPPPLGLGIGKRTGAHCVLPRAAGSIAEVMFIS